MNPKPDKLIPAIYGGIIMGVISGVPFLNILNCLCCAGIMIGGFMAVFFYKSNFTPDTPPYTSGDCLAVGALSGVFGAIVGTLLSMVFLRMFGNIVGEFLMDWLRNMNIPDEALSAIEGSLRESTTVFRVFVQFFESLAVDTIFGLLGGLIAYSVFKPKPSASGVMPPPPSSQPPASMPRQS